MEGKTLNQFIDDLHYNAETEFTLKGTRYIISGWSNDNGTYTLSLCTIEKNSSELFNCTATTRDEVVETFENAKIFGDKTIYEVEKDIMVMYG